MHTLWESHPPPFVTYCQPEANAMRAEQVQKPPSVTTLSAGTDKWKERNHLEGRAECYKHDRTCVWKKHS